MFAFIKKWKLNTNFNLSFANFRKKWQLNTGFHFSLFISILYFNIKFNLISLPPPKMKNEHAVSFFIFNFQKKRDEPNAGQVISFKQLSFVSFPVVDVMQFNSRTRDFATHAYWRQTDEIVCTDGNVQVPFNKGLFFVFLTCIFQKAWITDYVLRGVYKVKIWWRWRGVMSQFQPVLLGLCRSLITAPTLTLWDMIFKTMWSRLM